MTIYITESPAELKLIKKAMKSLTWSDLEELAKSIENFRSGSTSRSQAKVTAQILDAVIRENTDLVKKDG